MKNLKENFEVIHRFMVVWCLLMTQMPSAHAGMMERVQRLDDVREIQISGTPGADKSNPVDLGSANPEVVAPPIIGSDPDETLTDGIVGCSRRLLTGETSLESISELGENFVGCPSPLRQSPNQYTNPIVSCNCLEQAGNRLTADDLDDAIQRVPETRLKIMDHRLVEEVAAVRRMNEMLEGFMNSDPYGPNPDASVPICNLEQAFQDAGCDDSSMEQISNNAFDVVELIIEADAVDDRSNVFDLMKNISQPGQEDSTHLLAAFLGNNDKTLNGINRDAGFRSLMREAGRNAFTRIDQANTFVNDPTHATHVSSLAGRLGENPLSTLSALTFLDQNKEEPAVELQINGIDGSRPGQRSNVSDWSSEEQNTRYRNLPEDERRRLIDTIYGIGQTSPARESIFLTLIEEGPESDATATGQFRRDTMTVYQRMGSEWYDNTRLCSLELHTAREEASVETMRAEVASQDPRAGLAVPTALAARREDAERGALACSMRASNRFNSMLMLKTLNGTHQEDGTGSLLQQVAHDLRRQVEEEGHSRSRAQMAEKFFEENLKTRMIEAGQRHCGDLKTLAKKVCSYHKGQNLGELMSISTNRPRENAAFSAVYQHVAARQLGISPEPSADQVHATKEEASTQADLLFCHSLQSTAAQYNDGSLDADSTAAFEATYLRVSGLSDPEAGDYTSNILSHIARLSSEHTQFATISSPVLNGLRVDTSSGGLADTQDSPATPESVPNGGASGSHFGQQSGQSFYNQVMEMANNIPQSSIHNSSSQKTVNNLTDSPTNTGDIFDSGSDLTGPPLPPADGTVPDGSVGGYLGSESRPPTTNPLIPTITSGGDDEDEAADVGETLISSSDASARQRELMEQMLARMENEQRTLENRIQQLNTRIEELSAVEEEEGALSEQQEAEKTESETLRNTLVEQNQVLQQQIAEYRRQLSESENGSGTGGTEPAVSIPSTLPGAAPVISPTITTPAPQAPSVNGGAGGLVSGEGGFTPASPGSVSPGPTILPRDQFVARYGSTTTVTVQQLDDFDDTTPRFKEDGSPYENVVVIAADGTQKHYHAVIEDGNFSHYEPVQNSEQLSINPEGEEQPEPPAIVNPEPVEETPRRQYDVDTFNEIDDAL